MRFSSVLHYLCTAALPVVLACHSIQPKPESTLLSYFKETTPQDTLRFEVSQQDDPPPTGDTIPNSLFFTAINPAFLAEIDYLADSAGALVLGKQRFAIDAQFDACIVDIREAWFQHQSLLVFDKQLKSFTNRVTVAEFYGGDGGQDLTGSWILDYDGDGDKDVVRRDIGHSIIPEADSVREIQQESASLLLWNAGQFVEQPVPDSAAMVRRFPIQSFW